MNWKQWKIGLLVACISGAASVFVVNTIDPNIGWKQLVFLILGFTAKDALLYLKAHPVEQIQDTITITTTHTSEQKETKPEEKK